MYSGDLQPEVGETGQFPVGSSPTLVAQKDRQVGQGMVRPDIRRLRATLLLLVMPRFFI